MSLIKRPSYVSITLSLQKRVDYNDLILLCLTFIYVGTRDGVSLSVGPPYFGCTYPSVRLPTSSPDCCMRLSTTQNLALTDFPVAWVVVFVSSVPPLD